MPKYLVHGSETVYYEGKKVEAENEAKAATEYSDLFNTTEEPKIEETEGFETDVSLIEEGGEK